MEQVHQPRGDRNEIIQHDQPTVYGGEQTSTPLTFTEAEQHNAYALLLELHEHATTVATGAERAQDRDHYLGELALSAAVVAWWSRWQPLMMHKALVGGASLQEVAAAAGVTEVEAHHSWSTWAEQQAELVIPTMRQPLLDPNEIEAIKARLQSSDIT